MTQCGITLIEKTKTAKEVGHIFFNYDKNKTVLRKAYSPQEQGL